LEQATGHLDEQKRLVQNKVDHQDNEIKSLRERCEELQTNKEEMLKNA